MCSSCLNASRGRTSLIEYRARHIWDTVKCPAELFREGYRLVEVPRDGLCFLSVMYMLAHSTNQLPPEETIHKWFMGHPYEALLERSGDSEAPEPLRQAHARFLEWRKLSVNKWRDVWRNDRFDELCSVLPRLLEQLGLLPTPYRSYSYVPGLKRGRWADSHGSSAAPPTRFAVLLTLTPIAHYTLLERIVRHDASIADLDRLAPGGWLNDNIVNYYLQDQLAQRYPQHHFFSSFFYEKLLRSADSSGIERWDATVNLSVSHLRFIPINLDHHWTLLVCDTKQRRFEYYDSLFHDRGRDVVKRVAPVLGSFLEKRTQLAQVEDWPVLEPNSRPMQNNASDCGVYVCLYADWRCGSSELMDKVHFEDAKKVAKFRFEMRQALIDEY